LDFRNSLVEILGFHGDEDVSVMDL